MRFAAIARLIGVTKSRIERRFFLDVGKKIDQWTRELNSIREFLGAVQDVNFITRDALRGRFKLLIHAAEECRDALSDQPAEDVVEASPRPRRNVLAS